MCTAWLLKAACVRLTDKLVLHSLQQCLVCIFRLHGSRAFPGQHGANQVLPAACKKTQTHACKWNTAFKMLFLIVALATFFCYFLSVNAHRATEEPLRSSLTQLKSGLRRLYIYTDVLLSASKKNDAIAQHIETNLKKMFLIMFPLQKFPVGLGISNNNHPSINSTTSVRSVPLYCSWLAAQFQNVRTHATKFQPLFALQIFSLLI